MSQIEGEDQNSGTPSAPSRRAPRKRKENAAKVPRATAREEQQAATEAQAAVDDLKRQLAAVEAALTEERQKAVEAQRTLMDQLQARETSVKAPEPTVEETRTAENSFGLMPFVGFNNADLLSISQKVVEQTIKQPPLLIKHYTDFLTEMGRVATNQSTIKPDSKDKRFSDEVWSTNPFYQMYLQTYLPWQQSLKAFIDEAGLDKKDAERAHFAFSLYVDTVAPTNTLLGNPAAMRKMYETGGTSLVKGLTHMLEDLANNGGLPSQVDMRAFQVGKDLATSPGAVVFRNDVLALIQYQPATQEVYRRPLLFVPPQVNKYYVMDLSSNKSLVRFLVANGQQAFAISWRNPT